MRFDEGTTKAAEKKQWKPISSMQQSSVPMKKEVAERDDLFRKRATISKLEGNEGVQTSPQEVEQLNSRPKKRNMQTTKGKKDRRQVRGNTTSSSSTCCSSQSSSDEEVMEHIEADKKPKTKSRLRESKTKWVPKPTSISTSEPSSSDGSDEERRKDYIHSQVCKRINQLTLELDNLRQALPACEVFSKSMKRRRDNKQQ